MSQSRSSGETQGDNTENTIDFHVENTMTQDTTHEGDNDAANEANGEVNIVRRKTNNVVNGAIRRRIYSLYDEGNNISYIGQITGVKRTTVHMILKRYANTSDTQAARKGGDQKSKLSETQKSVITQWVDDDCLLTLNQLSAKVADVYNIQVSNSCIDRVLRNFHYTIKKVDTIPDARNRSSTIEQRFEYAICFRDLKQEIPIENFIFVNEVGFSVSTRPKRGRAVAGQRATTPVPFSRSRNISVVAAMTKNGMLYNKVHDTAVTGQDFQLFLDEIKNICIEKEISNPVIILDNARIHHSRILKWDGFLPVFLPPYCPFLNPIENCFSKRKNAVVRECCTSEIQLKNAINTKFSTITSEDCNGYYRNMHRYLNRSANRETINT